MSIIERPVEREVEVLTEREERARTLEGAALEIEVRGWCQGRRQNAAGEVCGVGAIHHALGVDWNTASYDQALNVWGGPRHIDIATFNDNHAESADEVTFLLRWRAEEVRDGR